MQIHRLPIADVFAALQTSPHGLSEEEAQRRLQEFGANEIAPSRKTSLFRKLVRQFTHFLAILLWIAVGLAYLANSLQPGEGMNTLAYAIVAVIVINALFSFFQEYRAEQASMALRGLLPDRVSVLRSSARQEVHAREIVPGDLLLLTEGNRVPADARLVEATFLKVNNAPLTGESEPQTRQPHAVESDSLFEATNIVFAGTTIFSGSGTALVLATGDATEFGKLARLTQEVPLQPSPLQIEIRRVTRVVTGIAVGLGVVFFVLGSFIGRTFWENFIFAIGILVANVPEGLLPTVTLALSMASQRMAQRNALVKDLPAVEALGSTTVICTDKTGTLTQSRMEVRAIFSRGQLFRMPAQPPAEHNPYLYDAFRLCNNASLRGKHASGDPLEVALLQAAQKVLLHDARPMPRVFEVPFDPERKRMTTVNQLSPGGAAVLTKGAVESLMPLCTATLTAEGIVPVHPAHTEEIVKIGNEMAAAGLRVLAIAYKELAAVSPVLSPELLERDLTLAGLVGIMDPPRPEVAQAIQRCHEAGIRVIMITGDHRLTAMAIGQEIGLVSEECQILEGAALDRLSHGDLEQVLQRGCPIFARTTPRQKLRIVTALKDMGEVVAVTGDGVNDGPALKNADIGIAMGVTGTDVAREAAQMVLLDDNFATIVAAIEEGRAIFENIRKFITYIFTSNIPEIVPYLAYALLGIPLPLTILQILAIDLGTDILPALALGAERPSGAVMRSPPRPRGEPLLTSAMLWRAYAFLGPIEAAAAMTGYFFILWQGGWSWGQVPSLLLYRQATTACLTAVIVTQIANGFVCRSPRQSVWSLGWLTNRLLLIGIVVEIGLQLAIVYSPLGQRVFATAALPVYAWLVAIPFALLLFAADEARKALLYR
ncbi:MAG TPA: cation-transporting P-type ATPase [Candidatus Tectomicrobia bacterium]|nr:cation-transporting P-type ATPase [Candidatus Tectomicrobia bacterium]